VTRIWDAETVSEIASLGDTKSPHALPAFSADGTRIVTLSEYDATATVWDAETGKQVEEISCACDAATAVFSPDAKRILFGGTPVMIYRVTTPTTVLRSHTDIIWDATFSPDSKRVVTASADGTARIWDAETGKELALLSESRPVYYAGFTNGGKQIVAVSGQEPSWIESIWNADTAQRVSSRLGKKRTGSFIEGCPNKSCIAEVEGDGSVQIKKNVEHWSRSRHEKQLVGSDMHVTLPPPPRDELNTKAKGFVSFSPDGTYLVTSHGNTARIWDVHLLTMPMEDLLVEVCTQTLRGGSRLGDHEMSLIGYAFDEQPIDVCKGD
jgi:WD40 repeat protein